MTQLTSWDDWQVGCLKIFMGLALVHFQKYMLLRYPSEAWEFHWRLPLWQIPIRKLIRMCNMGSLFHYFGRFLCYCSTFPNRIFSEKQTVGEFCFARCLCYCSTFPNRILSEKQAVGEFWSEIFLQIKKSLVKTIGAWKIKFENILILSTLWFRDIT